MLEKQNKKIEDHPRPRGGGMRSGCLGGTQFQPGVTKKFWRYMVVVATQCKCA